MGKPKNQAKQNKSNSSRKLNNKLKGVHPNSRKAMKITGAALRQDKLDAQKTTKHQKQKLLAEKIAWFRDRLTTDKNKLNRSEILDLIESYLSRFDSELDQHSIIHGIKSRKSKQHASRNDVITHQMENERRNFDTCGFEIPNLSNEENVIFLRQWKGELNLLPNIKLHKYSKKELCKKDK